jgi:hypothetical protein
VRLPAGTRELRIARSYGMVLGWPEPALRLVESGGVTRGELLLFWRENVAWPRRHEATRCSAIVDSMRVCVYIAPPSQSPDWNVVATRLDSLGVWTISERCEDNDILDDAGDLFLERLDAERFEQYSCNGPDFRKRGNAGRQAAALYDYFLSLTRGLAP